MEETKVFYEQYRDTANKEPFGYVLRWQTGTTVHVDIYEIDGAGGQNADGWWDGVVFSDGGDEMREFTRDAPEFSPFCAPTFHLYMKYDGTTHLWSRNYTTGAGDPQHVLFFTDMLRYVTARAAQYIQERLVRQHDGNVPEWAQVFPMKYNSPTIEVRPFDLENL